MQIIQFKCDKCGSVWLSTDPKKPQEVNISLKLNYGSHVPPEGFVCGIRVADQTWCRPCVENYVKLSELRNQPEGTRQATEIEMLVELLERLGFNRQQ